MPHVYQLAKHLLDFHARNGIPAMYEETRFVEGGGLMSYGPSVRDLFRRSAIYVDKILKGTKPADLLVEQPIALSEPLRPLRAQHVFWLAHQRGDRESKKQDLKT